MSLLSDALEDIEQYKAQFYQTTNKRNTMNFSEFIAATGCTSYTFATNFFEALDTDRSGDITLDEYVSGIYNLKFANIQNRLAFVFNIFDLDGDGWITIDELRTLLKATIEEDGSQIPPENMDNLVQALLDLFDTDKDSKINPQEFASVAKTYPDLLNGLTFGRFGIPKNRFNVSNPQKQKFGRLKSWVVNNPQYVLTYTGLVLLIAGCFYWRFSDFAGDCDHASLDIKDPITGFTRLDMLEATEEYKSIDTSSDKAKYVAFTKSLGDKDPIECRNARKRKLMGWTLPIAKGCGQAMKAVFTLILLPVSRNLMTALRETGLSRIIPIDRMIDIHMFLGRIGFCLAWTHTACHIVDFKRWQDHSRYEYWSWAFPREIDSKVESKELLELLSDRDDQPRIGELLAGEVFITGVVLISIYLIAGLFAFDHIKRLSTFLSTRLKEDSVLRRAVDYLGQRLNDFNYFWYSHQLFAVFYICLILHPLPDIPWGNEEWGRSDAWLWVSVPIMIYLIEKLVRLKRGIQTTKIVSADLLRGNALRLKLSKPEGFKFVPGQYVFVKCSKISKFEWHPFTLSSSHARPFIEILIREAGDWTSVLHRLVRGTTKSGKSLSAYNELSPDEEIVDDRVQDGEIDLGISVDGPYGAPAQNYADFEVIALIGAGMGVTPFASVLTHILDLIKRRNAEQDGLSSAEWRESASSLRKVRIQKVYFYWTVRSKSEASWFKQLLDEIAIADYNDLVDINVNITGIKTARDIRLMLLSLARYESEETEVKDLHSRMITRFGRINWIEVFEKIKKQNPSQSRIGVFYCGPNSLSRILVEQCRAHSTQQMKFIFKEELF